jgi:anti-sigma regulatory factor (Ser/Thr protein kinase)
VHVAREFVAARLRDGYACADTAVLLTSELVTNSAVHSDSRRHGGTITVTLIAVPDGIRAEVIDEGGVLSRPYCPARVGRTCPTPGAASS